MASGFLLGKFLPLHRGHMHLIEFARARVEPLTVLVCTLRRDPIPGSLRYEWVRGLYPDVDVRHCTDEIPSYPHEHPDFWAIWTATIRKFLPAGPDWVFSSERYGDELADRLGARHWLVDLERRRVPVSGTGVRLRPAAYWEHLPEPVRAYYRSQGVRVAGDG